MAAGSYEKPAITGITPDPGGEIADTPIAGYVLVAVAIVAAGTWIWATTRFVKAPRGALSGEVGGDWQGPECETLQPSGTPEETLPLVTLPGLR